MNIFKKFYDYYFPKINKAYMAEMIKILDEKEKKIFFEMSEYDKFHSLEVLKKIKKTELKNEKMYLKLALLHDCGKGKASFFKRVLHKFGFFTKLQNHPKIGAKKLENIDKDLSVLIENHHKKNYSQKMKIFQKCDDES